MHAFRPFTRSPGESGTTWSVLHRLRRQINRAFSGIDDRYPDISAQSKVNGRKAIINVRTASAEANLRRPGYPQDWIAQPTQGAREHAAAGAYTSAFPVVKRSGSRAITFNIDAGA